MSEAPPTPLELERTKQLEDALRPHKVFDTEEGMRQREIAIGALNTLVQDWVVDISIKKCNISAAIARHMRGKVFTFGSFRLGVNAEDGDVDVLVCVPRHISRDEFFDSFFKILAAYPHVRELKPVPGARVPTIKLIFHDVEMDLLIAQLNMDNLPEDLTLEDAKLLQGLSDKCVLSVNGCRVTDDILRLVPNIDTFRLALRCIKLWARKRAVYSNTLAFLGGVHLAILTARVCQAFPRACAATIVEKFFYIYVGWVWPNPVIIRERQEHPYGLQQWDPVRDQADVMPILTPAYPQNNASYTVTYSTREIMQKEFARGVDITNAIMRAQDPRPWSDLWEDSAFFSEYSVFVTITATTETLEDMTEYEGFVESTIRLSAKKLEDTPPVRLAVPFPKGFPIPPNPDAADKEGRKYKTQWYIALKMGTKEELEELHQTVFPTVPKLDLNPIADHFYSKIRLKTSNWPEYKPTMDVHLSHCLAKDLPNFVFPGGVRPEKPRKLKAPNSSTSSTGSATAPTNTTLPAASTAPAQPTPRPTSASSALPFGGGALPGLRVTAKPTTPTSGFVDRGAVGQTPIVSPSATPASGSGGKAVRRPADDGDADAAVASPKKSEVTDLGDLQPSTAQAQRPPAKKLALSLNVKLG